MVFELFKIVPVAICLIFIGQMGFAVTDHGLAKPNRSTLVKLSESLDSQKPLGVTDYAGFTLDGDEIFGSISPSWLVKYDLSDRMPKEWFNTDSELSVPAIVRENFVLAATKNGSVTKYDRDSGSLIWKTIIQAKAIKQIQMSLDTAFILDARGGVVAIDLKTGSKRWLTKISSYSELEIRDLVGIKLKNGNLYVGSRKTVVVLRLNDGKKIGEYSTPTVRGKFGSVIGDISFVADSIIFGRYDGYVFSFNFNKFSDLIWKKDIGGQISHLQHKSGIIYVGTVKGDFYLLDAKTGKEIWKKSFGETIQNSHVSLQYLYVNSSAGLIAKVRKSDSKIEWVDHLDGRLFRNHSLMKTRSFSLPG